MKKLRVFLSVSAFLLAMTAAFGFENKPKKANGTNVTRYYQVAVSLECRSFLCGTTGIPCAVPAGAANSTIWSDAPAGDPPTGGCTEQITTDKQPD